MTILHRLDRIISGGQTGVDRAALDAAMECGLACGGWCPAGRRAEGSPIPMRYPLLETAEWDYRVRTRKNIEDSDATMVLTSGKVSRGTALTVKMATQMGKPLLVLDLNSGGEERMNRVLEWLEENAVSVLNVAGPRESESPGIYRLSRDFLIKLLLPPG